MAKGAGMAKGEERDPVPTTVTVVDTPAGVIEGELYKKSAMAWKLRYFVLRDARLQYFAKRGDTKVRGELELGEGARLVEYDKRPFAFQVRGAARRARSVLRLTLAPLRRRGARARARSQVICDNQSITMSAEYEDDYWTWKRTIHALIRARDGGDRRSSGSMKSPGSEGRKSPGSSGRKSPSKPGGRTSRSSKAGAVEVAGHEFELPSRYSLVKSVGHGAYGVVVSAIEHERSSPGAATAAARTSAAAADEAKAEAPRAAESAAKEEDARGSSGQASSGGGRQVAIKKIPNAFADLIDARRIVREIRLLRHMHHENVICMSDLFTAASHGADFDDVYIVTDLMETDLHRVIYSRQQLTEEHVQFFLYQARRRLLRVPPARRRSRARH